MDLTQQLRQETESARCHNIDAKEKMGLFSAAKERAPNATLCYLSSKMRGKKNRTVDYLDAMNLGKQESVVSWAVSAARRTRQSNYKEHVMMRQELSHRADLKRQKKDAKERRKIVKKVENIENG